MKLYLKRIRTREKTTDGVLTTETGYRICDTAEHTPTMLPTGIYKVRFRRLQKLDCRAPSLKNTKCHIIPGNGVYGKRFGQTIIVGEYLIPGVVIKSQKSFDNLVESIDKSFLCGQKVALEIS